MGATLLAFFAGAGATFTFSGALEYELLDRALKLSPPEMPGRNTETDKEEASLVAIYMQEAPTCIARQRSKIAPDGRSLVIEPYSELARARRNDLILSEIITGVRQISITERILLRFSSERSRQMASQARSVADAKLRAGTPLANSYSGVFRLAACGFGHRYLTKGHEFRL